MSRPRNPTRSTAAALLALTLLSSCVKKTEYDALQIENQALQARVDQVSSQLQQTQADLAITQSRLIQFADVQTQLLKTQQQLQQSQDALKALQVEFEKFRSQRRSAMVGKKFPVLSLDSGKVLREAEITAVSAHEIAFRHDGGLVKVAMANTSADLRWEACYDPQEAKEAARNKMLADARLLDSRLAHEKTNPLPTVTAPKPQSASNILLAQLAAQRTQLNADFQALAAKNTALLRSADWNSATPEASPLLNSVSGSRAVLGISRLQSQRDAILQTLQQLRSVAPVTR